MTGLEPIGRVCGVYVIQNVEARKIYVGSSLDIRGRLQQHRGALRRGVHPNAYLQAAYRKYGADVFRCWVAELCDEAERLVREQWWLDAFEPFDDRRGYNLEPRAGSRRVGPKRFSAAHRAALREARLGKPLGPMSDAAREAHRRASLGHEVSRSTRRKISMGHRARAAAQRAAALRRGTKHCSACCAFLPFAAFHRDRTRLLGLQSFCKKCAKAKAKARRIAEAV